MLEGEKAGGTIKYHPNTGNYIAWDESVNDLVKKRMGAEPTYLNATSLSVHFGISKLRINPIFSELGLIQKGVKGWTITKLGEYMGGKQFEYERTGVPYVSWPESILTGKMIVDTIKEMQGEVQSKAPTVEKETNFREKFQATHRAADGHYVRSRAEMLIDNWLYMSELVHAYERKLPVEEEVYCDFYLPIGKVYIEYWGSENSEKYRKRKEDKLKIYEKYGFNLIQLEDSDIQNLDDILPKKLLKFGIQTF